MSKRHRKTKLFSQDVFAGPVFMGGADMDADHPSSGRKSKGKHRRRVSKPAYYD